MNDHSKTVRGVAVGLVTGVAVTVAMGQAAAPDRRQGRAEPPVVQRYQIAVSKDNLGSDYLYILDHQTGNVYRRFAGNLGGQAQTVEQFIQASN